MFSTFQLQTMMIQKRPIIEHNDVHFYQWGQ